MVTIDEDKNGVRYFANADHLAQAAYDTAAIAQGQRDIMRRKEREAAKAAREEETRIAKGPPTKEPRIEAKFVAHNGNFK
jgi:hypothetical protein